MKNLMIIAIMLFAFISKAQTEKVEQYCEVLAMNAAFSSKVNITIDFGEAKSVWKDNRIKNEDGSVKKFNSIIDAINYMGADGWKLVNAFPITISSTNVYHYVFKKEFEKKDISQ